jgi:hypothetical protein
VEFFLTPYCSHSACCLCRIFAIDSTGILLHSHPPRNHLPRPALLARGQYLGFLGIPLGNACPLAIILSRSPVLVYSTPQHKKSVARWFTSHIQQLAGGMTRVELLAPPDFVYTSSQHCFLRFPAVSIFGNHPFTIMSIPTVPEAEHQSSLSFLVRAHSGFTPSLATRCKSKPDKAASVWIDGPYGGLNRPVELLYDTVILVAGGSAIPACVPWLLYLTQQSRSQVPRHGKRARLAVLVWAMRVADHFTWIEKELLVVVGQRDTALDLVLRFHITRSTNTATPYETAKEESEKSGSISEALGVDMSPVVEMEELGEVLYGRPIMEEVVQGYVDHGKKMLSGCGPQALRNDLSNACANIQRRVLKGELQDVEMNLEAFGW